MARPTKQGIDYFPLDTEFADKVELFIVRNVLVSYATLTVINWFERLFVRLPLPMSSQIVACLMIIIRDLIELGGHVKHVKLCSMTTSMVVQVGCITR